VHVPALADNRWWQGVINAALSALSESRITTGCRVSAATHPLCVKAQGEGTLLTPAPPWQHFPPSLSRAPCSGVHLHSATASSSNLLSLSPVAGLLQAPSSMSLPFVRYSVSKAVMKGEDFSICLPTQPWPNSSSSGAGGAAAVEAPKTYGLYAVMDGHNGVAAAEFTAARLPGVFATELSRALVVYGGAVDDAVAAALGATFIALDREFCERCMLSGCTCTVVALVGWTLSVANIGDSRAVLDTGGREVRAPAWAGAQLSTGLWWCHVGLGGATRLAFGAGNRGGGAERCPLARPAARTVTYGGETRTRGRGAPSVPRGCAYKPRAGRPRPCTSHPRSWASRRAALTCTHSCHGNT
jgi:Protein phosphatase 2C